MRVRTSLVQAETGERTGNGLGEHAASHHCIETWGLLPNEHRTKQEGQPRILLTE